MTRIHSRPLLPKNKIPRDVLAYCAQHGILPHLQAAIALAFQVYKSVEKITTRVQADPEVDEERLVIDVVVSGTIDEILARKKEYTTRWLQSVPSDAREHIRVLYHFA